MRFNFEFDQRFLAVLAALAGLWLVYSAGSDAHQAEALIMGVLAGRGLGPGGQNTGGQA